MRLGFIGFEVRGFGFRVLGLGFGILGCGGSKVLDFPFLPEGLAKHKWVGTACSADDADGDANDEDTAANDDDHDDVSDDGIEPHGIHWPGCAGDRDGFGPMPIATTNKAPEVREPSSGRVA